MSFNIIEEHASQELDKKVLATFKDKPENFWDFDKVNTKEFSHAYHSYPAMMIPQVARNLIDSILVHQSNIKNVFDPFMGSGTTLVEGILKSLDSYGTDLNPLSRLMAKVKSNPINPQHLENIHNQFNKKLMDKLLSYSSGELKVEKPNFDKLDFWFKESVTSHLQIIKNEIKAIDDKQIQLFFWVVFSETVRYTSNTRNNEFKLYRMEAKKLEAWNPDVPHIFEKFLVRNIQNNKEFYEEYVKSNGVKKPEVKIYDYNAQNLMGIPKNSFDLLVTSPPYGDSKTTVAYGQFSRLSLQWLDFENIEEDKSHETNIIRIDSLLMGGKVLKTVEDSLNSPTLSKILSEISEVDEKRAKEVLQFYFDMDKALGEISRVMKPGSFQCWVVGNRTVKKIKIPTDQIIVELYKKHGVNHVFTFERKIPNKRMPKENSPTNVTGEKVTTMNGEIIIILKKECD